MESGIQSSFIPHDAAVPQTVPTPARNGGLQELVLLIAIVFLVASGALAGAVFLYDQYAQSSAASKLEQLKRAKDAFEPSLIQKLTRLDDRMTSGEQILENHIAPTELFASLQATTLSTVSYQTLDFQLVDQQHMTVKMTGVAQGVNSVALQADLMSKSGVIMNPIFSDISRQADGVHFSLAALVDPAALSYMHVLSAASQQGAPSQSDSLGMPQSQTQQQIPARESQSGAIQQTSTSSPFMPRQGGSSQSAQQ